MVRDDAHLTPRPFVPRHNSNIETADLPPHEREWVKEHRRLATNYILGYFVGPPSEEREYFDFQLATELLSALIANSVRGQQSLSYAAYAPFHGYAIPVGGIYASTPAPNPTYHTMLKQIELIQSLEIPAYFLREFKDGFVLARLAEQMTNAGQAEALGRAAVYFGDYRMADGVWDRLASVRPSRLRRAAERYMRDLRLVYLGDTTHMLGGWDMEP